MATTLATIRDRAPRPLYGQLLDKLITSVPILGFLKWEPTPVDELSYRRRRGVATAPHYDPNSTMGDGVDEAYDPITAKIHPFGGVVENPNIGLGFGNADEAIEAKIIACGKQFVTSFIGGQFANDATFTPTRTAGTLDGIDAINPGPYWDTRANRSGAVLKCRVDGGDRYLSLMAEGDTGFGTETTAIAVGTPDAVWRVSSANINYYVDLTIDSSDLVGDVTATKVWALAFTSETNAFDSVLRLCPTSQFSTLTAAATIDWNHVDDALTSMKTSGQKAICVSNREFNYLLAANRDLGGSTFQSVAGFSNVLNYRGAYIFGQDGMPITRTVAGNSTCGVLIGMDLDQGVKGLYKSNIPGGGMTIPEGVLRALPEAQRMWGGLYVRSTGEDRTHDNGVVKASWYASIMNLDAQGVYVLDGLKSA